jgi:hypothetical protein
VLITDSHDAIAFFARHLFDLLQRLRGRHLATLGRQGDLSDLSQLQ